MSEKARRQRLIFAVPFFGLLIGAVVYDVVRLEQTLGMPPSFLAVFVSVVIIFVVFNLVDAIIIDWLILMVLWPGLGVLPGTEGMAGYKDARLWTKNLLKGFILAPVAGLLAGGIVYFIYL
jgi:cobalamin synthase